MRVIFSADQHIAPARQRLDPKTGLSAALLDRYRCARFCVEDGIEHGGELFLSAGDLFDSPRPDPTSVCLAREVFAPAQAAGVATVILAGNHELPRAANEKHALTLLGHLPRVTMVDRPVLLNVWAASPWEPIPLVEPTEKASADGRDLALQVAAIPWPSAQLLLADEAHRKLEPGALQQLVAEKMLDVIRGLAAQLIPDVPAVLLGHFSIDVAEAGGMSRLMALGSDWVLNLHDLTELGFDAILLGHVHKPQPLSSKPPIAYCGSPECITHGEAGEEKRYLILDIDHDGAWIESICTPHRRFLTIDACDRPAIEIPREELDGAIVRLRVPDKATAGEVAALREQLEAAGVHELTIEVERPESTLRRETDVRAGMDIPEALKAWAEQHPEAKEHLAALVEQAQAVEAAVVAPMPPLVRSLEPDWEEAGGATE